MNGRRENSTQEKTDQEKLQPPALPNRRKAGPDRLSPSRILTPTTHHHMLPYADPYAAYVYGLAHDSADTST